jgi:formate dehydrogenase (NADP+) beta subunit
MGEMHYRVRVADPAYWREQIKCQYACPVHTDARGYVRAIAAGDYEQAYLIARGPNPLASLCGRICGAPCEAACRRGTIDQPISIRALKRFVCEKFGSDARSDAGRELFPYLKDKTQTRECDDVEELSHLLEFLANTEFP